MAVYCDGRCRRKEPPYRLQITHDQYDRESKPVDNRYTKQNITVRALDDTTRHPVRLLAKRLRNFHRVGDWTQAFALVNYCNDLGIIRLSSLFALKTWIMAWEYKNATPECNARGGA